ncbi:MAG: hypothetical protein ABL958_07995 [Bdellovibrionia bacterium]
MVPTNNKERRDTRNDRRTKPRKGQAKRRAGDTRKTTPQRQQQKMLFPALLFIAYILIARPVSEPKIVDPDLICGQQVEQSADLPETSENSRGPASIKSSKTKREKFQPISKKIEKPAKVSAKKSKFKPRDDIGPSVTFSKDKPVVIDDALRATTADAAKGRFPANVPVASKPTPQSDDAELDVSDDFTVGWKKNK